MKKVLITLCLLFAMVCVCPAADLVCDPEDEKVLSKYKLDIDGVIINEIEPEKLIDGKVRLKYNVDYLTGGKHTAIAKAGNERGEWSEWSEPCVFYLGVPTPRTIRLYCAEEIPERISREDWTVTHVSSFEPNMGGELVFDGDTNTRWHSNWTTTDPDTKHPHELQIDLGRGYTVSGFYILPRLDSSWNGTVSDYKFYVSVDGESWIEVSSGKLLKVRTEQFVAFAPIYAKYISLVALSEVNNGPWTTVGELNVLGY